MNPPIFSQKSLESLFGLQPITPLSKNTLPSQISFESRLKTFNLFFLFVFYATVQACFPENVAQLSDPHLTLDYSKVPAYCSTTVISSCFTASKMIPNFCLFPYLTGISLDKKKKKQT